MDATLFRFVGEVLAAVPAGLGLAPSLEPGRDGFAVAARLLEDAGLGTTEIVTALVDAGCNAILAEGLAADAADDVLEGLAAVVARYAGRPEVLADAAGPPGLPPASSVTLALMTAAIRDGSWPVSVDASSATAVLEAVLQALFQDPERLSSASAGLARITAESEEPLADWSFPAPPPEPGPPVVQPAPRPADPVDERLGDTVGLAPAAAAELRRLLMKAQPKAVPLDERRLVVHGRQLSDLVRKLRDKVDAEPPIRRCWLEAGRAILDGAFELAGDLLSRAEDEYLSAARRDWHHVATHMQRAADARVLRAELAAALGDPRRAVRHIVGALRCLPASAHKARSALLIRQGRFLMDAGRAGDPVAFREATELFEQAADEANQGRVPALRAEASIEWADAATARAKAEDDPRLALAATDAIGEALLVLDPVQDGLWGLAQLRLGHAILLSSTGSPDVARLTAAADAFGAACGSLIRSGPPDACVEAYGWCGLSLVRLARVTNEPARYEAAVAHLQFALSHPEHVEIFPAHVAALAEALGDSALMSGFRRGDQRLLSVARDAYRKALAAPDLHRLAGPSGHLQEQLAACLWRLGEVTGDRGALDEAVGVLSQGILAAEQAGDQMRSGLLLGERDRLMRAIDAGLAGAPLGAGEPIAP